jgi:hypothetical protein
MMKEVLHLPQPALMQQRARRNQQRRELLKPAAKVTKLRAKLLSKAAARKPKIYQMKTKIQ